MIELSNLPAAELLYSGDDIEKDVRPSKSLGITTGLIWTTSDEADYSFQNFSEVLELVRNQRL